MKSFIQIISTLALVIGLSIALYSWQAQNIVNAQAEQQAREEAQANNQTSWSWSTATIPPTDRVLGLAFGFSLSFLGAFGLYAQLRITSLPTASSLDTQGE